MAAGAAALTVVGTAVTIAGQRKAAKAQARAARENAKGKRAQALELLDRFDINSQALVVEGELVKAKQRTSFAGKGIDVGAGSSLSVIEETNALVARQLILDRKEADFKFKQLMAGADADLRLAGDIRSTSRLNQAGTFLSGAGGTFAAASRR